ncbi:MAG TPA: tetratricopeptide repeat protein, partial [Candidatus Nitrosotenuis sp.]|nr:tetratricopeptide repeat protein [Candidatus Nitrosotenuis sp.]
KTAEQHRQRSDYYEAAKFYEKAALLGHGAAQLQLGLLFREGQGVEKDEVEAFRWIAAAADQGLPEALYEAAVCYWEGIGTDADRDQAFHLMQEAAQRRHPRAPRKLAKWDAEMEAEKKAKRVRAPAPRVTSPPLEPPWWKGTKAIVAATTIVLLAVMFSFEGVRNAFLGSSRTDESKSGPPIITPPPKQVTQKQPWVGPGRESDLFTVLIRDNFETNRIWKALDSAPCRTNYRDSGFELRNEPPQEGSCQFLFWRQSPPAIGVLSDAVRISITARPKEMSDSKQSHYGLIFGKATTGDDSDPNQFIFWLDQNGEYELFRYSEERKWAKIFGDTLANAGLPPESGPGASITLRVDVRGREIWVGLNGKWLRQYANKSEVRGYCGIYVHKMGDTVLFDDLEISKLIL